MAQIVPPKDTADEIRDLIELAKDNGFEPLDLWWAPRTKTSSEGYYLKSGPHNSGVWVFKYSKRNSDSWSTQISRPREEIVSLGTCLWSVGPQPLQQTQAQQHPDFKGIAPSRSRAKHKCRCPYENFSLFGNGNGLGCVCGGE